MTKQSFLIAKLTGVIIIIFVIISLSIESTTGGIHMHDTYFVMNAAVKWILFIILSLFIASLMGAIAGRFRTKLYNRMLLYSTLLVLAAGIYVMFPFLKPE